MPDRDGRLVALTPELAGAVAGWVHSAAEVNLFAGDSLPYPLTADAIVATVAEQGRLARVLVVDGTPVAFGALRSREDDVRLGWVLTDPGQRGRGWGRRLIVGLLDLARAESPFSRITLGVYEHNAAARSLYADLGFTEVGQRRQVRVEGVDWVALELERTL